MMVGSQNNNTQEDALLKKSVFSMSSFSPIFHWKHMYTVNNPLQSSLGKQATFRDVTTKNQWWREMPGVFSGYHQYNQNDKKYIKTYREH